MFSTFSTPGHKSKVYIHYFRCISVIAVASRNIQTKAKLRQFKYAPCRSFLAEHCNAKDVFGKWIASKAELFAFPIFLSKNKRRKYNLYRSHHEFKVSVFVTSSRSIPPHQKMSTKSCSIKISMRQLQFFWLNSVFSSSWNFLLNIFFQIFWSHYRKKVCLSLKPTRKVIQKKGKISATYFPKWRKEINHLQSILHASFLRKKLKLNRNLHKFNWMISPGQRKTNSNIN